MVKNALVPFILLLAILQASSLFDQTYVAGGDYDYAPVSFIDDQGDANGLDIDILKAIEKEENIQFKYHLSAWDSALHYIQTGEIDVITGIIFSEEREKFVDFTVPIHTEYYSIFIRNDLEYNDVSSLYDYSPIVMDKDISIEKYLIPMGLYKNYTVAHTLPDAFREIEAGNADYVLAPNSLGVNEIEKKRYQNIEIKGPPVIPSIYCMAVKKGDHELLKILNEGILKLGRSGELSEIQKKWEVHERDEFKYERIAKSAGLFLGFSLFLLLLFFIWIRTLRIQIRKKTENIEQKNLELQNSEFKLRELNATKDKLFSIIAHDLKAPFNAIIGFSNLLTKEAKKNELAKIGKYSDIISRSSHRAMDLLSNLMEWSNSQSGRMTFNPENFDIDQVINEHVLFYTEMAKQKSITLESRLDSSIIVFADKAMVNTILRNLISNALKFTDKGDYIIIAAKTKQEMVEISITDTGTGMTREQLNNLFVSGVQNSTPGTQDEKGTGLGLLLCKEFVEKNHGKIWAESEPDKGAVFYFTLPVEN